MGYSRLPIQLLSCPFRVSRFVSFVQEWLLSPGHTKGSEKRHLFHKHKEPLWRLSPFFTFKHSFWCRLRSIEICLHWFEKKILQVAEGQNKPLSHTSTAVCAASSQQQTVVTQEERGCRKGHGAHPGWRRAAAPCVATGLCYVRLWVPMDLCFTIHVPHLFHGEMALLAFFIFIQYK